MNNYLDGLNFDLERPLAHEQAHCYTTLIKEMRETLAERSLTKYAQLTVDIPWAPHGVDNRYYEWKELAKIADYLFVMAYDTQSQMYEHCIAAANSPYALIRKGLEEYIVGYEIDSKKLILGLPWYAYEYPCEEYTNTGDLCIISQIPFYGSPCSDASGAQKDYGEIMRRKDADPTDFTVHWDDITKSPFYTYGNAQASSKKGQIWFDSPKSLRLKYALVKEYGLGGGGMWHADTLRYSAPEESKAIWDAIRVIN